MKNKLQTNVAWRGLRRNLEIAGHWLRGFWPVLAVVGVGATWLREAVVESILSTPHPALVYGIFAVAAAAVWLAGIALFRYLREESLLLRLQSLPGGERLAKLQSLRWKPDVLSVCLAIFNTDRRPETRLAAIEHELYAYEEHLASSLTLPGYLSGALVGLGLVGTFVGLLGTLADLAGLFSAMTNMGGQNVDPVAMFTDMLTKLQAPMRSMGTAFVASLYGLLGSLVLGLVIYSIKRSGSSVLTQVRALIRLADSERETQTPNAPADDKTVDDALVQLADVIRNEHSALASSLMSISDKFQHHIELANEIGDAVRSGTLQVALKPDSIVPLLELANLSLKNQASMLEEMRATGEHQKASMREVAEALKLLGRNDATATRRGALAVVVICAVVAVACAVVTVLQFTRETPVAAPAAAPAVTLNSVKEMQAPVETPVPSKPEEPSPVDVSKDDAPAFVEARSGQSLARIAAHAKIPLATLIAANPQLRNPGKIAVGEPVYLPPAASDTTSEKQ